MAATSTSVRFTTQAQIIEALRLLSAHYDPRTSSLLRIQNKHRDAHPMLFRPGFLSTLEERREVIRRLRLLDERGRTLLVLWFVEGRPVAHIARWLGISRVHCYRLKERALQAMLDGACERDGCIDDDVGSVASTSSGVGLRTGPGVDM